jgi:hypothetical protein
VTACNQQIVTAFEELGLSPEEIAAEQELDIASVKAILLQNSSVYRKAANKSDDLNFSDEELVRANQVIVQLAQYSEDENLRAKCAMYIRDDKRGRRDVAKQIAGIGTMHALAFNEQMKKALEAVNRAKAAVIDIPALAAPSHQLTEKS